MSGVVRGLETAIEALTEQLGIANRRIDELQTDPMTAIGIQTLSQAVEMLRGDVDRERDRADRAERQVEDGGKRIDELQRRVDGLYSELADARTAAVISGADAAALRTQLALLTERRPWWRRWFR